MKALSIRQPWAWLIVQGIKDVENRTWRTSYRGPLLIHTGKTFDMLGYHWIRDNFPHLVLPTPAEFVLGGIVGQAVLVDCVRTHTSPWYSGEQGFVLSEPLPLPFVPCQGALGIFEIERPA